MFSLKWGENKARKHECGQNGKKMDIVGNWSFKSGTALNYKIKHPVNLRP